MIPVIYRTAAMLAAVKQMPTHSTFLRDRYFPTQDAQDIFPTEDVLVEYKDGNKKMAPCVIPRKKGITIARDGYRTQRYTPPYVAPQRTLTIDDLDELAWELNVEWYDTGASLDVKRQLIIQADLIHSRLGTKWAVEQVISTYFGAGEVREWWTYSGKPHHFKVLSDNPAITNERIAKFMHILGIIKRESSWLDSILIALSGDMKLYVGMAYKETAKETVTIGAREYHLYHATAVYEASHETICIYSRSD